jgi:hypothetical protein
MLGGYMEENNHTQLIKNASKKENVLKLICCLLLVIIAFIGGYFLGNNNKSDDKTSISNSNNQENKEEENNTGDSNKVIVEIPIDEDIKALYYKYHADESGRILLSSLEVETIIYDREKFSVSDFKTIPIPHRYNHKILNSVKNELDSYSFVDGSENIQELKQKYFKEFFGDNLLYSDDIKIKFCSDIIYNDGKYDFDYGCGDTSVTDATYELIAAKKDDNNIYLYENVIINDYDNNATESFVYKWTYSKGKDNNYYLLEIERV